jgi:hypothetical protein
MTSVPVIVSAPHRIPTDPPTDDLQIGEVGLPKLIGSRGLVLELIGRLHDLPPI